MHKPSWNSTNLSRYGRVDTVHALTNLLFFLLLFLFFCFDNLPNAHLGQHAFRNVKYEKRKNNYDVLWLILWRPARETETKRQSTYRRPKLSEYYENNILQLQIENYTCSTRLWLSYFICNNKNTFVKQMSPDLAMLLTFLLATVDWLDKVVSFNFFVPPRPPPPPPPLLTGHPQCSSLMLLY